MDKIKKWLLYQWHNSLWRTTACLIVINATFAIFDNQAFVKFWQYAFKVVGYNLITNIVNDPTFITGISIGIVGLIFKKKKDE